MDLIATIRVASRRLVEVAAPDPFAPVARYPGWTMLDLLVHTGSVHRRTMAVVRTLAQEKTDREFPPDEAPATVLPWFTAGAAEMADLLESTDPEVRVWGFGPEPSVGTWRVRMALETDVHRHDAEASLGVAVPLDADLAALGIDEFVSIWGGSLRGVDGAVITLQPTDHDRTWTLVGSDRGVVLGAASGGSIGVATASDLYLWMLGRPAIVGALDGADLTLWSDAFGALPDARR